MIKKQDPEEKVFAKCREDVGLSATHLGIRYSFNNKEWTECPHIVYSRNRNTLILKEELTSDPKLTKSNKKAGK